MLPIVEIFKSIQGEGKYQGVPSIFIRVSGCNLRCCFSNSVCDTYYTSYYNTLNTYNINDVLEFLKQNSNINHIVITGGEPMLYRDEIEKMLDLINKTNQYHITIETNGTLKPLNDKYKVFYSISPKLSTSVAKPSTVVDLPSEKIRKHVFSKKEVDNYNNIRINYDSLYRLIKNQNYQLKFVYSNGESLDEIKYIINNIKSMYDFNIDNNNIYLMPEGDVEDKLKVKREDCVKVCIENNWRYTDRIHIIIWGNKKCV